MSIYSRMKLGLCLSPSQKLTLNESIFNVKSETAERKPRQYTPMMKVLGSISQTGLHFP